MHHDANAHAAPLLLIYLPKNNDKNHTRNTAGYFINSSKNDNDWRRLIDSAHRRRQYSTVTVSLAPALARLRPDRLLLPVDA
jgi:hypothetical protein